MENLSFTPKGIRREAGGLLTDNWNRALSTLCLSLLALSAFLLFNQLVTGLIGMVEKIETQTGDAAQMQTLVDYFAYYRERGFTLSYTVSIVLAAFYFMFASPLNLGITRWYQSLAQCGDLKVGQVFHYYRGNDRFIDALVFELSRVGRKILVGALSFAPSIVCFGIALSAAAEGVSQRSMQMSIAGAALLLVGLLVYALVVLRWFVAKYIFVAGIRQSVGHCFSTSAQYMKGCVGKVLKVVLSFVPLLLTCVLVVPAVYVIPLYNAAMAACAQDIIDARTPA